MNRVCPRARSASRARLGLGGSSALLNLLCLLLVAGFAFSAQAIERRKDQYPTEPSFLVFPLPYSLPGIGEGFFIPVAFSNIGGSFTDAFALLIVGDATGTIAAVEEVHLLEKRLLFDLQYQALNKAAVNVYDLRGMSTGKDDFSIIELSKVDAVATELRLTFWERRLEFFVSYSQQDIQIDRIRDSEGILIADLTPPFTDTTINRQAGILFDYTDDRQDPRKGIRLEAVVTDSPADDPNSPDFTVADYSATLYLPIGEQSTWAFHVFRSAANVSRQGDTNVASVTADLGLNCGTDPVCLATEAKLVNSIISANTNGTSTSLGGEERMRAYPGSRFQGAHTLYYTTEFRWNLTEEATPFDYFIWKDVRTGVQLAFFYEVGSVAETSSDLGNETRSDFGVGLRMIAGSGEVYRADVASGDEGTNVTIIVDYPF